MTLDLILAHPDATRLSEVWHPMHDPYAIADELEAKGRPLSEGEWHIMTTECRTVGDLAELVGHYAAREEA